MDGYLQNYIKNGTSDRRAGYLEEKIEEIVKTRFPESLTVSNISWKLNGKQYETDLITFIDSHAVIFEAKSNKVTDSAFRGAPGRMRRHIEDMLIKPSIQSIRLKKRILYLSNNPGIKDELRNKLPINLSMIKKVIRVTVTLEDIATLQGNQQLFKKADWVPEDFEPCPSMSLADFETLFDFLDHPVHILHYLIRREVLEKSGRYYGDELDFMGFYLSTLFNELSHDTAFQITGSSEPLDDYYNTREMHKILAKPQPKISKTFKDILVTLQKRSTYRWTEIGVVLNMISPDAQSRIESKLSMLRNIVRKSWRDPNHNNILVFTPPETSEFSVCFVLYKNANEHKRDAFFDKACDLGFKDEHVKYCLLIGKNIDLNDLAYHHISINEALE